jgi:hypothetical protein
MHALAAHNILTQWGIHRPAAHVYVRRVDAKRAELEKKMQVFEEEMSNPLAEGGSSGDGDGDEEVGKKKDADFDE